MKKSVDDRRIDLMIEHTLKLIFNFLVIGCQERVLRISAPANNNNGQVMKLITSVIRTMTKLEGNMLV